MTFSAPTVCLIDLNVHESEKKWGLMLQRVLRKLTLLRTLLLQWDPDVAKKLPYSPPATGARIFRLVISAVSFETQAAMPLYCSFSCLQFADFIFGCWRMG